MKLTILLIMLTVPGMDAFADIYRWVDKDGAVHYSDHPPQEIKSERLQLETTGMPGRPDEGELRRRRALDRLERDAEQRMEARRARSVAKRAQRSERLAQEQRCLEARRQLAVLQEQLPVYRDEGGRFRAKWLRDTYQGAREYLDDKTRASEIERVLQRIATTCQHPDDAEQQDLARRQWIRSEYCAAARVGLEALERPRSRATRQALEEQRQEVEAYCQE